MEQPDACPFCGSLYILANPLRIHAFDGSLLGWQCTAQCGFCRAACGPVEARGGKDKYDTCRKLAITKWNKRS